MLENACLVSGFINFCNFCNSIGMEYMGYKDSLEEVQGTINFTDGNNVECDDSREETQSTINLIDNDISQVCEWATLNLFVVKLL